MTKPVHHTMNDKNEYGVPWHACNGYRLDEHYWAWLTHRRLTKA